MKLATIIRGACAALLATALLAGPAAAQNTMQVTTATTTPGSNATVQVLLTHDTNVQGFQTALSWDNTKLTLSTINFTGMDIVGLLAPNTIEFFTTTADPAISPGVGWGASAAIFDFTTPFNSQTLPPGSQQSIVFYRFSTVNNPALVGTTTPVTPVNNLGSPPIFNVITVSGSSVLPTLVAGGVQFVNLPLFKRGDANIDGMVNVADAIFMIQYLFNNGASPQCLESANANGDTFTDVSDAVYMIQFQFLGGSPPPTPYPACGVDPGGASGAECVSYSAC